MSKACEKCIEGLVAQGESIKRICSDCAGTGKVDDHVYEAAVEIRENQAVYIKDGKAYPAEVGSFLEESGGSGEAPVGEETPA